MRSYLFAIMCLILSIDAFSQAPPHLIPPSPNAYAFAKYGDIPVSLSSGIPNISVPLFKLTDHELVADVSLSYYARGIKVDEEATDVGLGWSLNAGGSITRIIKGKPDQLTYNNFFPRTNIPMNTAGQNLANMPQFISGNNLDGDITGSSDNEPDIFIFNFNGRNGKFSFDSQGHVVLQKKEDLLISWEEISPGLGLQKFTIKDERGVVYEFAQYETTQDLSSGSAVVITWYLSSITSPTGNIITFEYLGQSSNHHYVRDNKPGITKLTNTAYTILAQDETRSQPFDSPVIDSRQIHKISCSTGSIEFIYHTGVDKRKDCYETAYSLDQVVVYDPNQLVLKKFKLLTSYFESDNIRKFPSSYPQFDNLNYRLRLDAVQEYNANNIPASPVYQFSYLGDNDPTVEDVYTLPYRLSPEQDHWGFYNKSGNLGIFPGCSGLTLSTGYWYSQFLSTTQVVTAASGANREPDTEAMKAGMLQRITYPTGGYTDFQFEANYSSGYKVGGLRIKSIKDHPVIGLDKEKQYSYQGSYTLDPNPSYFELFVVHYDYYGQFFNGQFSFVDFINPQAGVLSMFNLPTSGYPTGQGDQLVLTIKANPQAVLGMGSMGYDQVKVSEPGNGYTITTFDNSSYPDYTQAGQGLPAETTQLGTIFNSETVSSYPTNVFGNHNIASTDWPYPNVFDNSWKRDVTKACDYYSENGVLLRSETYNYARNLLSVVPGYKITKFTQNDYPFRTGYVYTQYGVPVGQVQLQSQTSTVFDKTGQTPVANTTNYYYDSPNHTQATREAIIQQK
jgi:hypothetical protein